MSLKQKKKVKHSKKYRLIRLLIILAIFWGLSSMLAYSRLRPEIDNFVDSLEQGFDTTTVSVRSPLPFCIAIRVHATSSKGKVVGRKTATRYYVWLPVTKDRFSEKEAPLALNYIWWGT